MQMHGLLTYAKDSQQLWKDKKNFSTLILVKTDDTERKLPFSWNWWILLFVLQGVLAIPAEIQLQLFNLCTNLKDIFSNHSKLMQIWTKVGEKGSISILSMGSWIREKLSDLKPIYTVVCDRTGKRIQNPFSAGSGRVSRSLQNALLGLEGEQRHDIFTCGPNLFKKSYAIHPAMRCRRLKEQFLFDR